MDAGARRTAPRKARFDGFVKHRNPSSIISYSILATQRSDDWSTCAPVIPGAYVPYVVVNSRYVWWHMAGVVRANSGAV